MAKRTQPYRFGVPAKYKAGKKVNIKKVQKSRVADKKKKKK